MKPFIINANKFINITKYNTNKLNDIEKAEILKENETFDELICNISNELTGFIISQISAELNILKIYFKKKSNDEEEKILHFSNVVSFHIKNFDFNNISKFNLSFSYSIAVDYSLRYTKEYFAAMFWDSNDKIMPKCSIVADELRIIQTEMDDWNEALELVSELYGKTT